LIPWPIPAVAGFFGLGLALRAWKSKSARLFWLRAWPLWMLACFCGAGIGVLFFSALPGPPSSWRLLWGSLHWQMGLWYLGSLPLFLALSFDLRGGGGFQKSGLALAGGLALGPPAAGAFPLQQLLALLGPFALSLAAARLVPRGRLGLKRALWALFALDCLGLLHGLYPLPPWLGGPLLAACLGLGLSPYGPRSGLLAAALAAAAALARPQLGLAYFASMFLICALMSCGWWLARPRMEPKLAETP
jgi:hypothetical protein